MSDVPPIATERLELVSMSPAFIGALLAGRPGAGGAGLHGAAAVSPPRLRPGGGPGADGLGGTRARRAAVPAVHRAGQRALPGDGGEDGLPPRRRADGRRRRPGARLRARPRVEPDSPSNIA